MLYITDNQKSDGLLLLILAIYIIFINKVVIYIVYIEILNKCYSFL